MKFVLYVYFFINCRINFDYVLLLAFKNTSAPTVISNQRSLERSLSGMASIEQAMILLKELGYMNVLHEEFDGNYSNSNHGCPVHCRTNFCSNYSSYGCSYHCGTTSCNGYKAQRVTYNVRNNNLASLFVKPLTMASSKEAPRLSLSIEENYATKAPK